MNCLPTTHICPQISFTCDIGPWVNTDYWVLNNCQLTGLYSQPSGKLLMSDILNLHIVNDIKAYIFPLSHKRIPIPQHST